VKLSKKKILAFVLCGLLTASFVTVTFSAADAAKQKTKRDIITTKNKK
tara:strand:- start:456 stop:599 length:144 start_codon:yes stop_codon:yes gene_type:complete